MCKKRSLSASLAGGSTAESDTLPVPCKTVVLQAFLDYGEDSGKGRILGQGHHRARRSRAGPSATGHVHRLDRPAGAPPPGGGDRRQLRRRGSRRVQRFDRDHHPPGQLGHRARPGPGDPGGHRRGHRHLGARGDHDQAARRRKVRRRRLQGLRRAARSRRFGGQCALGVARRRGLARLEGLPAGVRSRRPARPDAGRRRLDRERHDDDLPRRRGHLRRDGVRRDDDRLPLPRDGVPHARPQDHVHRRARRRRAPGRVSLRGRHQGLRVVHQRVEGRGASARRLLLDRQRPGRGRSRDAVEHVVPGVGLLLRQQRQHPRGRLAPLRVSGPRSPRRSTSTRATRGS